MAREWRDTNGASGLPVIDLGHVLRVPRKALEDLIGTQIERDGRVIIPLPHPSGASTWPNRPGNAARIKQALRLIDRQRRALGL